jgi:hypothetical protein
MHERIEILWLLLLTAFGVVATLTLVIGGVLLMSFLAGR